LALAIRNKKLKITHAGFGLLLFLSFTVFGKQIYNAFIYPEGVNVQIERIATGKRSPVGIIVSEISFPYQNVANLLAISSETQFEYRYAYDLYLSVAYLIPKRVFDLELPDTVSDVNTRNLARDSTVPVDLISFGYFCFGIIGVAVLMCVFGVVLRAFERAFSNLQDPVDLILRISWMFFLASRVMYGDPTMSLRQGFYLVVPTIVYFIVKHYAMRKGHVEVPVG
jgi:hypothetical protein